MVTVGKSVARTDGDGRDTQILRRRLENSTIYKYFFKNNSEHRPVSGFYIFFFSSVEIYKNNAQESEIEHELS